MIDELFDSLYCSVLACLGTCSTSSTSLRVDVCLVIERYGSTWATHNTLSTTYTSLDKYNTLCHEDVSRRENI